jgi:hypothetical protein
MTENVHATAPKLTRPVKGLDATGSAIHLKSNFPMHGGFGRSAMHQSGHSVRPSSGSGISNGQIAGKSSGEGRGVPVAW